MFALSLLFTLLAFSLIALLVAFANHSTVERG
jgi:hypothetical protein